MGKSPRTIHRWIEEGRLPGHKVEVDGQYRWVVDIDKVKAKDYATPKPTDAQAELLDLREEVAWLSEQLAAKDQQISELRVLLAWTQPKQLEEAGKKRWWEFWKR